MLSSCINLTHRSYATGKITEKSDVYSFSVVLLEIITGHPAITRTNNDQTHIISWRLKNKDFSVNSGWRYLEVALTCVARNSEKRPTMNHVAAELQECKSAWLHCVIIKGPAMNMMIVVLLHHSLPLGLYLCASWWRVNCGPCQGDQSNPGVGLRNKVWLVNDDKYNSISDV
ncbi:hypothetical protein Leryth_015863 [Lithospermum erythrorhizon]|nr:hypothetical protein Leryth_015863 [Lithospermum erythrorhizon]